MSTNDEDYSSYLAYESVGIHILALFSGFTFTAITIILTQPLDPSQIQLQVTLFFLAFLLDVFQFLLFVSMYYLSYCITKAPPEMKGRRIIMWVWLLGLSLWGLAIVLMFLLWNLTYLALASGIMYALFIILTFIFAWKPFIELSKKLRSQK